MLALGRLGERPAGPEALAVGVLGRVAVATRKDRGVVAHGEPVDGQRLVHVVAQPPCGQLDDAGGRLGPCHGPTSAVMLRKAGSIGLMPTSAAVPAVSRSSSS